MGSESWGSRHGAAEPPALVRPRAGAAARGALARLDGPGRGRDLRLADTGATRDARGARRARVPARRAHRRYPGRAARAALRARLRCRRLAPSHPAAYADAIRAAGSVSQEARAPALTATENLVVTAIAYLQPVTRAELSRLLGKEVSRDTIARLKRLDLVGAGPRMPALGAPLTYVTTHRFLSVFGLGSLRDLPDIEALEDAGLLARGAPVAPQPDALDDVLGVRPDDTDP